MDDLLELAAILSAEEQAVVCNMTDGECVYPAARIAEQAYVPLKRVGGYLRRLRVLGLADYGPLIDQEDGTPKGSGTWLNDKGLALRDHLRVRTPSAVLQHGGGGA